MSKKSKLIGEGCVFVDPCSAGSMVAYRLTKEGEYFYGHVNITDCSRMVSWDIDCGEGGVRKLQNAIKILKEALVDTKKARKLFKIEEAKRIAKEKKKKKKKKEIF
jgi:hypothetical protein